MKDWRVWTYIITATLIVLWWDTDNPKKIWTIFFVTIALIFGKGLVTSYLKRKLSWRRKRHWTDAIGEKNRPTP